MNRFNNRSGMFIKLALLFGYLTFFSTIYAQDPEFIWAKEFGGVGDDRCRAIRLDNQGNVYTTGRFFGTVDFDPGPGIFNLTSSGIGTFNIFVLKLNSSGEFVWAKKIGGSSRSEGWSLEIDNNGNILSTGIFQGTVDFDPGAGTYNLISSGLYDVYVSKLNSSGDFIWARQIGGAASHQVFRFYLDTDVNGDIYISGHFSGTGDFDPGPGTFILTSFGSSSDDIFIEKLNSAGDFAWVKQLGGTSSDWAWSLAVDNSSNVYTTGWFQGTGDFDPGANTYNLTSNGNEDIFISKLNSLGEFVWAKQLGGTNLDVGISTIVDNNSNVYTTGVFRGLVDFDPGAGTFNLTSFGSVNGDAFILKLNTAGTLVWAKQLGSTGNDWGYSIDLDDIGDVYSTGSFSGNADFDPGTGTYTLTASVNSNIFISKLNSLGEFAWAKQLGSSSPLSEEGSIAALSNGDVYTTGHFSGTGDFDPGPGTFNLTSNGGNDVFISKVNQTICNPVNITTQPVNQLSNTCDSVSFSVSVTGDSPFSYQWYKNTILIPGATNSVYTTPPLTLADNGNTYYCIARNCNNSSMQTSSIATLTVVLCVSSSPYITLNHSVVGPGETLTIMGSGFTPDGNISLSIRNESGDIVGAGIPISYIDPGKFTFYLPVNSSFLHSTYTVAAVDVESGVVAPLKTFMVDNELTDLIDIISPTPNKILHPGVQFDITWKDLVFNSNPSNQSGFVKKTYSLEISQNNGSSWTWIKFWDAECYADQINTISTHYTINYPGSVIIRVSELTNPANMDQTLPISVVDCVTGGFTQSLEWDYTVTGIYRKPIGLAADGTARIFIKLTKNPVNTKQVSSIQATLSTIGNNYSGTALLGKIMYATNHTTYDEEANNANATSITYPAYQNGNGSSNAYWFWLVAPDDYTSDINEESSERQISATFTITYTDNSSDIIQSCSPISISRPALLFVHGIFSDPDAFKFSRYRNNQSGTEWFCLSDEWKVFQRINLDKTASFDDNAGILLRRDPDEMNTYENSIKSAIIRMHTLGIAARQVDYVCHSMGGSVARALINDGKDLYSPGMGNFLNYHKGYVHKLITICTPHNGSFLADFLIDMALKAGGALGSALFEPYPVLNFIWDHVGEDLLYETLPEGGKNLQSFSDGVVFQQTNVINHLISADVDSSNTFSEATILNGFLTSSNENKFIKILKFLYPINLIHNSINILYNNSEFLSQSDLIVQLSSQLAGKNSSQAVNITTNPTGIGNTSIIYGLNKDHIGIQEDITVGTRVKKLLNAQVNSGYFDTTIPANNLPQHPQFNNGEGMPSRHRSISDTLINRVDTQFVKITSPALNSIVHVDSSLSIVVHIKNTTGFQNIRVFFQSDFYVSEVNNSYQAFHVFVQPEFIGKNKIVALAQYDSLGFTVNHIDTISVVVGTSSSLDDFYVTPASININPDQVLKPDFHVVYPSFIGLLNPKIDSLYHTVLDTNVISYDQIHFRFIAKDTGTTSIVFTYKGIHDTMSIYISTPLDKNVNSICPSGNTSFYAGINDNTKTYQWQLDSLNGFANISDNQYFSGTHSPTLMLTGIPSHWYNAKFKCIISDPVGISESEVFILRFKSTWLGNTSSAWENSLNWSCQAIPDAYTDVVVKSITPHYPEVNSNAVCRTLHLSQTSTVLVKPGHLLDVKGD